MTCVVLACAGIVTASCGTTGDEGPTAAEKREQAQERRAQRQRAERERKREACSEAFSGLVEAVGELDSRLNVGLSYDEYTTAVGDVRVAYDQSGYTEVDDFECLDDVGLPLERALNQYVKASNVWGECFEDFECDTAAIQPELQGYWEKAATAYMKARGGVN